MFEFFSLCLFFQEKENHALFLLKNITQTGLPFWQACLH